jgi:hypothetical protein
MPMTDALFDSAADGSDTGSLGFWRLPAGLDRTLADWSTAGPLAYVEAEYFGGVGEQHAAVWDGGTTGSAISQALRRLGAVASAGEDEFSAVGLDRHRHGEGWIA